MRKLYQLQLYHGTAVYSCIGAYHTDSVRSARYFLLTYTFVTFLLMRPSPPETTAQPHHKGTRHTPLHCAGAARRRTHIHTIHSSRPLQIEIVKHERNKPLALVLAARSVW